MDIEARLEKLLSTCAWTRDSATALGVVPSLAADLPPLVELDGELRIPCAALGALVGPVVKVLSGRIEAALAGEDVEAVQDLDMPALAADPLVAMVARLLMDATRPGLQSHAIPALAVAWVASRVLGGKVDAIRAMADSSAYQSAAGVANRVAALQPAERGRVVAHLGWSLAGRIGGAAALASAAGVPIRACGIHRQLLPDRLLLAYPRGTLDADLRLDEVSALLELGVDGKLLVAVEHAAQVALQASRARVAASKASPFDVALAAATPEAASPLSVLLNPVAGPFLVCALPELLSGRELKAAGVSGPAAEAIGSREAARGLAATWADLGKALLRWDVLSVLCDRIAPVRTSSLGGSLLVPRLEPGPARAVLAVRWSELGQALATAVAQAGAAGEDQSLVDGAIQAAWRKLLAEHGVEVHAVLADHGVAVLADVTAALRLARAVAVRLCGGQQFDVVPLGQSVTPPSAVGVGIGIAWGPVGGGTDGQNCHLAGPTVAEAVSLAGSGAGISGDPLGVRAVGIGPGGLANQGIAASADAVAALEEAAPEPCHRRGSDTAAGGIDQDFATCPVRAWWEDGDQIVVLVELDRDAPGASAAEILTMNRAQFCEFHQHDARAAAAASSSAEGPGARAPADPFAEHRTGELADQRFAGTSRAPDPFATEPGASGRAQAPYGGDGAWDPFVTEPGASGRAQAPFEGDGARDPFATEPGAMESAPAPIEGTPSPEAPSADTRMDAEGASEPALAGSLMMVEDEELRFQTAGGAADSGGPDVVIVDDDEEEETAAEDGRPFDEPVGGEGGFLEPETEEAEPAAPDESVTGGFEVEEASATEQGGTEEGAEGALPFADRLGETDEGFEAPVAPSHEAEPGTGEGAGSPAAAEGGQVAEEIRKLFDGYLVVPEGQGTWSFGLREGRRLRDAHTYSTEGDVARAYQLFLQDKISEGFVPILDRTRDIPGDAKPQPIDGAMLGRAYLAVVGG